MLKDTAQRCLKHPTSRPTFEEEIMLRCLLAMHDICLSQPGRPTTCGWATCRRTSAASRGCQFCQPPLRCRTFARYVAGGQVGAPCMPGRIPVHSGGSGAVAAGKHALTGERVGLPASLHGGGCPGSSEITTSFFRPLEEPLQIGPDQTRLGSQRPWLDWMEGGQFPGIGDAAQCS